MLAEKTEDNDAGTFTRPPPGGELLIIWCLLAARDVIVVAGRDILLQSAGADRLSAGLSDRNTDSKIFGAEN